MMDCIPWISFPKDVDAMDWKMIPSELGLIKEHRQQIMQNV